MSVGQKLAGQMQKLTSDDVYGVDGKMDQQIVGGSATMKELWTNPKIIQYAEIIVPDLVASAREEFYKKNPPTAQFELPRNEVSLIITWANQKSSSDPAEQALMDEIKEITKGVYENPYLRQNCYAFAVEGANRKSANPLALGAAPGNVQMGFQASDGNYDPKELVRRVESDGAIAAGSDPSKLDIPEGMRLVALYSNNGDYHFNRIDLSADGKQIAMTGKNGIVGHEREILQRTFDIEDAFDPNKTNVMNYTNGYQFQQFFYVPKEGLNVGMDAHLIKKGALEPLKDGDDLVAYQKSMDMAYHMDVLNNGQMSEELKTTLKQEQRMAQENIKQEQQAAKVENEAMAPAQLESKVAGVEPMEGSFPGQLQISAFIKQAMENFKELFSSGPSQDRGMEQGMAQQQQMNRNPGLSGPGMSMGA